MRLETGHPGGAVLRLPVMRNRGTVSIQTRYSPQGRVSAFANKVAQFLCRGGFETRPYRESCYIHRASGIELRVLASNGLPHHPRIRSRAGSYLAQPFKTLAPPWGRGQGEGQVLGSPPLWGSPAKGEGEAQYTAKAPNSMHLTVQNSTEVVRCHNFLKTPG